jgi:hypothetical protein
MTIVAETADTVGVLTVAVVFATIEVLTLEWCVLDDDELLDTELDVIVVLVLGLTLEWED